MQKLSKVVSVQPGGRTELILQKPTQRKFAEAGNLVFSAMFYAYFFITAAIGAGVELIVLAFTALVDPQRSALHVITTHWAYHYIRINPGWKIIWKGRENLPGTERHSESKNLNRAEACIIVSNHQSTFDTFLIYGLKRDFRWLGKKWVFAFPIVGWLLKLGKHICVGAESATEALKICEYWLQRGVSIAIFPEGTRSPDGNLLPFRSGAFRLAIAENVPILPVVIEGTRGILPKYSLTLRPQGAVEVRILPTVYPAEFDGDFHKLRTRVKELMEQELNDMRKKRTGRQT